MARASLSYSIKSDEPTRFRVRVTPRAEEDNRAIHQFIALDRRQAADDIFARIYDMIESLSRMPRRFSTARENSDTKGELRQVVVARYRIVFEIAGDRVFVHTVRHASRQPADDL